MSSTLKALGRLPPANKDTLAFLILHLQKVAQHSDDNKMTLTNLAKIFGPTIVGHASPNPTIDVIQSDIEKQFKVMLILLEIQQGYLGQALLQQGLLKEVLLRRNRMGQGHLEQYRSKQDNPEVVTAPSPPPKSLFSLFTRRRKEPHRSPPTPAPRNLGNSYKSCINSGNIMQ